MIFPVCSVSVVSFISDEVALLVLPSFTDSELLLSMVSVLAFLPTLSVVTILVYGSFCIFLIYDSIFPICY